MARKKAEAIACFLKEKYEFVRYGFTALWPGAIFTRAPI